MRYVNNITFVLAAFILLVAAAPALCGDSFVERLAISRVEPTGIKFEPKFGIEVREVFDDNIYGLSQNEIDDKITVFSPAADLGFRTDRSLASVRLGADVYSFADNTKGNFTARTYGLAYAYDTDGGIYVRLSELARNTREPRRDEGDNGWRGHLVNDFSIGAGYAPTLAKLTFGFRLSHMLIDYDAESDAWLSRSELSSGIDAAYWFLPKTALVGAFTYKLVDYPEVGAARDNMKPKSDNNTVKFGLQWAESAVLKGHVMFGLSTRDYINNYYNIYGSGASRTYLYYQDQDFVVVDTLLRYDINETTDVRFIIDRSVHETRYPNTVMSPSTHYASTKAGIAFGFGHGGPFQLEVGGAIDSRVYNHLRMVKTRRESDVLSAHLDMKAAVNPWMTGSLRFELSDESSNDLKSEVVNNVFSLGLTTMF